MKAAFLGLVVLAAAMAQDQTGRVEGVVQDAVSHQPVKKATITLTYASGSSVIRSTVTQGPDTGPSTTTTDSTGAFTFSNLAAGQYQVTVMHSNYPQARIGGVGKTVQVSAGDTATNVTVELIPGAVVAGHVVDEDGDPLSGCIIQPHPARNFNAGIPMMRIPRDGDDGSYRISGIPPGKYIIAAQCSASVFQPRPLSEGPDPPPSAAYPLEFYPAAREMKSAQVVELLPGAEKSGIDFQMRPVPVTSIRGALAAGSADWRGRDDLRIQLVPLEQRLSGAFGLAAGAQINPKDGSFELRQVFPGSYRLVAFSQEISASGGRPDASNRIGAVMRVDVADKPIELSLQLHRAMDVSGTVEIDRNGNSSGQLTFGQIVIQLISENQFGGPSAPIQVNDDGTFSIKSVLPGEWQIRINVPSGFSNAPSGFLKSARMGGDNVLNGLLDLTSGSAAPLHIIVGTNTATIRGTAPPGQLVFATRLDDGEMMQGWRAATVNPNGQFILQGLVPGKYRLVLGSEGGPPPDEGSQELTLGEGETATIELKPEPRP